MLPTPFGFKQYGQCGKWVSDIFPKTAEMVDDILLRAFATDIPSMPGLSS